MMDRRVSPLGRHHAVVLGAIAMLVALSALCATPVHAQGYMGLVTRVVDGDTVHVAVGNTIESVRYIGINTPKIRHPTRGREPYGEVARQANRDLVEGKWVRLVLDAQQRDRYGRLLAYVYVGDRFVNAELVHRGYASAATYPPNVRYSDYFAKLERGAREAARGLWSDPYAREHRATPAPAPADVSRPSPEERDETRSAAPAPSVVPPRSSAAPPAPSGGGDINVRG